MMCMLQRCAGVQFAASCLMLIAVTPASAAGGGEDPVSSPLGWLLKFINFFILAGGAWYLLRGNAPAFFRGRAEAIVASITEAGAAKEEAERRLREAEAKLSRIEEETEEIRAVARHEAAAEVVRIRSAAREEGEKIERAARAEIETAERAARMELRALAAQLAAENAEAQLYRQVTPEVEARLVSGFAEQLSGSAP